MQVVFITGLTTRTCVREYLYLAGTASTGCFDHFSLSMFAEK